MEGKASIACVCACVYVRMCVCMYVCTYICVHVCKYVYVCVGVGVWHSWSHASQLYDVFVTNVMRWVQDGAKVS
jgi:hypothetical protein